MNRPPVFKINGRVVSKEQFEQHKPGDPLPTGQAQTFDPKAGVWNQPKHCEALAYEKAELPAAKLIDQQLGLGNVEYDSIGCPVFYSPGKYDEYVKAHGFVNRSSVTKGRVLAHGELERARQRICEEYPETPNVTPEN